MFILPLLTFGCPAEQLGVHVPTGGVQALSQEDLQRDVWLLAQAPPRGPELTDLRGLVVIEQRLGQMKTLPAFGDSMRALGPPGWAVCGQKDGRSGDAVLVGAVDAGAGADAGHGVVAALISLAKAFDLNAPPRHTLIFCAWSQVGGLERLRAATPVPWERLRLVVTLGPLGGEGPVQLSEGTLDGRPHLHATTGARPEHGGPEDRVEALHYEAMVGHLRQVHGLVEAALGEE